MSLINDMLRDLDTRNASANERGGLAQNVRALPGAPEKSRLNPLLLALVAAALGGAAVWVALSTSAPSSMKANLDKHAAPPVAAVASTVAPVPESNTAVQVAAIQPATATPPPQVTTASPSEAASNTAAIAPAPAESALRLETAISAPPAVPEPVPAATYTPAPPTTASTPTPKAPKSPAPTRITSAETKAAPAPAPTPKRAETAKEAKKPTSPPNKEASTQPPPVAATKAMETEQQPRISKSPTSATTVAEIADGEYRRGIAALRRGEVNEAGEALRAALRNAPNHVAARQALLALLSDLRRWPEVESLALDGVGLLPQHSEWALLAARIMYERGNGSMALSTLDQYAAGARLNADYQILHALLLQRAGRTAEAVACYRTALSLRPNEGALWYGLGGALDADQKDSQARQAYEKARASGNLPPELLQAVERRLR